MIANALYAYSPYGETTVLGPDEGNPLQYTGRENDGTGLYYYRARYYDPVLSRFISEDLIGSEGGTNLYAYVNGDPITHVDPNGLRAVAPATRGGSGRAPRTPRCVYWRCVICEPVPPVCPQACKPVPQTCPGSPSAERCTTFYVSAPPGHPGEGGFMGPGGYAGDAAKMPECLCIRSVLYPF
jgi:RHS repeat-associated protein